MRIKHCKWNYDGVIRLEILVIVVTVVFLVALLAPPLDYHSKPKAQQINCINNLKQVGLCFQMWSADYGNLYPMQFRTNDFDGPGYANGREMYRWFQAMSNEFNTPKVVFCPSDDRRSPATNFTTDFGPGRVSYFVGLEAAKTTPTVLLAGDSNLTNDLTIKDGVLEISAKHVPRWTAARHENSGDIVLGDGSVQKLSNRGVKNAVIKMEQVSSRLVLPEDVK